MAQYASQLIGKVGLEGSEKTLSGLKNIDEATKKTSGSFDMLKNAVSFAGGQALFQGLGFLKNQLGGVFTESLNAQAGMAQTVQVLKSTHDISGMTAQGIADLATQYSHLTQFSDDTVQSAENMLLTFTNIGKRGGVFQQATQTALDMSQALGQDVKSSAIQLGKALGDPLTGFSALMRVGVTFSQQQKDSIKTFMAHNNIIAAQKVILTELGKEFGGSALAAGKTFTGMWAIMNQRLDDVRQNIGDALLPIVTRFLEYISTQFIPRLNDFSDWFGKQGIPLIQQFGDWFQRDGIPAIMNFGGEVLTVTTDLVHFAQWLQAGSPPAQALTKAAIALGVAIAGVKIAGVVNDMTSFIAKTPEMVAKMFLVQQGAQGIAGKQGLASIGTEAANAEKAVGVASSGMKLSLAGVLGSIGLVAAGEIGLAMWIKDTFNTPQYVKPQPDWITHHNPADDIKKAADAQKYWNSQIEQAWQDMADLTDKYQKNGIVLGTLSGITNDFSTHLSAADQHAIYLKSDLDKVDTHYEPHVITTQIEKAMNEARITKLRLDDLASPVSIQVGTRSVDAAISKVIYAKSKLDDLGGSSGTGYIPGHASGITNSPYGHWAMVGERGPEPMYVPRGASILPSGTMPSGGGQGSNQPVYLVMDGTIIARVLMPHIVDQIRYAVGTRGL